MPRVVIVGGGIAGLACAHRLTVDAGDRCEVIVLEQSDRIGGPLRSERVDGFLCEWGPNGFLDNAPDTLALVSELGLDADLLPSLDHARRRFVFRRGRLHLLPLSPGGFLRSGVMSLRGKLRLAAEPLARRKREGDETIHAFAERRLGREAADVLIDPMVSGVFAGDARQLSLQASFRKIWELEAEHGGLFRALVARRKARRASGAPIGAPFGRLTSFAGGIETLPLALGRSLGARVRTRTSVVGLEPVPGTGNTPSSWRVSLGAGDVVTSDHVVLTVGPSAASRLVMMLDAELAATLARIPSAPVAVIALGYDLPALGHPLDGFGFLVPRGEGPRILGALWDSSVYAGRAPAGQGLIRVMAGGAHDPDMLALTDDDLVGVVRQDLQTVMGITTTPRMVRIIRHAEGIPQYTVGHLDRLARIEEALMRHAGLHLAGHGYRGVGINHGIADANKVAARVAGAVAGAILAHM